MGIITCELLAIRWPVEEFFKKYADENDHPLGFPSGGPQPNHITVRESNGCQVDIGVRERLTLGSTLKDFMRLLRLLQGISGRQEEIDESRTMMVWGTRVYNKLREELKDNAVLAFDYIFIAYIEMGGEN